MEIEFSPDGATFVVSQEVTLTCATADVAIYYAVDGSEPTVDSTSYTVPFTVSVTTTVKAVAAKDKFENSAVATATFIKATVATPTLSLGETRFPFSHEITLSSATEGALFYYTIDGTDPTTALIPATTFNLKTLGKSDSCTLKVLAVKERFADSAIATFSLIDETQTTIFVEGSTFTMGSPVEVTESDDDERPNRDVTLTSFWMSESEVTQKQWTDLMTTWPSLSIPDDSYGIGDTHPAYYVSWFDALEFCNALSAQENLDSCYSITKDESDRTDQSLWSVTYDITKNGYRLPTEAEWEYAARGGKDWATLAYIYAGTSDVTVLGDYAWYSENSGEDGGSRSPKTHAVGGKLANALGLFDMSGNVFEWCWDWSSTYPDEAQSDPVGPVWVTVTSTRLPIASTPLGFAWFVFPPLSSSRAKVLEPENSLFGVTQAKYVKSFRLLLIYGHRLVCFSRKRKTKLGFFEVKMNYKIFNVPVPEGQSETIQLNQFLNGVKVVSCSKELVCMDKAVFWSFVVEYYSDLKNPPLNQPIKKEGVDYREILSEEDFAIFSKLRDIRKTVADEQGVPVYAIFSNEQLAQMVTTKCTSKSQLSDMPGIDEKKLEQYAPPILDFLTAIFKE